MSWLIAQIWILLLVAFVLGSAAGWLVHRLVRNPARGAR
jgi:uncharacterized membrane-anchored protein YhcB (DUF1043 family)